MTRKYEEDRGLRFVDGRENVEFRESGLPVDPSKAPSYEEALATLKAIDYWLSKGGPGSKKRIEKAREAARKAVDFEVWTSSLLNREGGYFPISYRNYGTFMDPATETYHSM